MPRNSLCFAALFAVHMMLPIPPAPAQTADAPDIVMGDVWLSPSARVPVPRNMGKAGLPSEEIVTGDVWVRQEESAKAEAPVQSRPDRAQAANR
jgi:hypothetical protein